MLQAAKQLAINPKDPPTYQMYSNHSKSVSDAIKRLVSAIRYCVLNVNLIHPKYRIRPNYRTHTYKCTVKQFLRLQIAVRVIYFFIITLLWVPI